jgi:toxin YoeB
VKLIFAREAWDDYVCWQGQDMCTRMRTVKRTVTHTVTHTVTRIHELIAATHSEPFVGIGKPKPLRHALAGFWSWRITGEHRMVYQAQRDALVIAQRRYRC